MRDLIECADAADRIAELEAALAEAQIVAEDDVNQITELKRQLAVEREQVITLKRTWCISVRHDGERNAGISAYTDEIYIELASGDPGGEPGEFETFLQQAFSEWYDGAQLRAEPRPPSPDAQAGKVVPLEPTEEMVIAYLDANAAYWVEHDKLPAPLGKWRSGTAKEATKAGYSAMLAAAPTQEPSP